jgi:flagella basal body P-ring formation protein FlgA
MLVILSAARDLLLLLLFLALTAVAAIAQPTSVSSRVASEIGARWGVAPERIQLEWRDSTPPRDLEIASLLPRTSGWWTIVPSAATRADRLIGVRAGVIDTIRVARHALVRGVTLSIEDFTDSVIVRWSKPPATARQQVEAGWVTRRMIAAGEELRAPAVGPAPLIASGDSVTIVTEGTLSLAIKAVAMRQATRAGDRLDVRLAGGRTLSVTAVSANTVHPIAR